MVDGERGIVVIQQVLRGGLLAIDQRLFIEVAPRVAVQAHLVRELQRPDAQAHGNLPDTLAPYGHVDAAGVIAGSEVLTASPERDPDAFADPGPQDDRALVLGHDRVIAVVVAEGLHMYHVGQAHDLVRGDRVRPRQRGGIQLHGLIRVRRRGNDETRRGELVVHHVDVDLGAELPIRRRLQHPEPFPVALVP